MATWIRQRIGWGVALGAFLVMTGSATAVNVNPLPVFDPVERNEKHVLHMAQADADLAAWKNHYGPKPQPIPYGGYLVNFRECLADPYRGTYNCIGTAPRVGGKPYIVLARYWLDGDGTIDIAEVVRPKTGLKRARPAAKHVASQIKAQASLVQKATASNDYPVSTAGCGPSKGTAKLTAPKGRRAYYCELRTVSYRYGVSGLLTTGRGPATGNWSTGGYTFLGKR